MTLVPMFLPLSRMISLTVGTQSFEMKNYNDCYISPVEIVGVYGESNPLELDLIITYK